MFELCLHFSYRIYPSTVKRNPEQPTHFPGASSNSMPHNHFCVHQVRLILQLEQASLIINPSLKLAQIHIIRIVGRLTVISKTAIHVWQQVKFAQHVHALTPTHGEMTNNYAQGHDE